MNINNVNKIRAAIEKNLETEFEWYAAKAEQKARMVFQTIVKPYCKKKKLRFLAGNGAWAFFANNESAYFEDHPFEDTEEWETLMSLLTMEVPGMPGNGLGTLMPDCTDYTYEEERDRLVSDAAKGDPGEKREHKYLKDRSEEP